MSSWSRQRKALLVGLLLTLALGLRLAEVERTAYRPVNDAAAYLTLASQIAHTGDYAVRRAPGTGAGGSRGPTAYFPPAFPYFLAAVDLIDGHTGPRDGAVQPARISQAILGTAVVGLTGLVALEAFGELVGMVALGVAVIYPVFIELSALLVAENLLTLFVLAAIWAALRAGRSERPYRWVGLAGVLTGLAALSHVNGVLLVVPLGVAAWKLPPAGTTSPRRRLAGIGLLLATTLLTMTPWVVRDAVVLHRFVPVADEGGYTLVGTYNAASAHNHQIPYKWRVFYTIPGEPRLISHPTGLSEPTLGAKLESQALHYIGHHPLAPLAVLYHNTRRLLELEGSYAYRVSAASIDLPEQTARIGVVSFWLLCLLAIAGAFTRVARRAPWWLWFVPLLMWLSVALVNAETPRFREPLDAFLILLGSCAIATALKFAVVRLAPARGQRRARLAARPRQLVEVRERLT
jgi:4-amino-4-deoxy-L-arabinose transferase-like glycosyltransferase